MNSNLFHNTNNYTIYTYFNNIALFIYLDERRYNLAEKNKQNVKKNRLIKYSIIDYFEL